MKYAFLLIGLLTYSFADVNMNNYALQKSELMEEKYFIKFAAFKELDSAINAQNSYSFSTNIIYMKKYYSVVSDRFSNYTDAKRYYNKIENIHKDAYIFRLYKKPLIIKQQVKKIKPVKKPSKLYKAIALYGAKRYEESLMAFDRILIDNPTDIKAKLYYAKSLYKLSLFAEAKDEFIKLLGSSEQKEASYYLQAIEKKQKRHFFNAVVGIGIGHNDNVNLTTDVKTTQYGPYTLTNDINKTDSTYGLASFALKHRYKGGFFDLYSTLYSYNEFAHTADGNDLNFIDISSAIIKKYKNFLISLPLGANTSYLDGNDIGYNLYTKPSLAYNFNKNLKTYIQASYIDNTIKFAKNRDYRAIGGGLGIRYKKGGFQSALGVNTQDISSKKDLRFDISKNVLSYFVYSKYYFLKDFYIGANLLFKNDDYSDLDAVMGYKREDDIVSYGLSSGKNITKNTLLNLKYQHTQNKSNINAYSYEKNKYEVECKYKF